MKRCPSCDSKDLWQPHKKTPFDLLLEKRGYSRWDCRNCWKRTIFRAGPERRSKLIKGQLVPPDDQEPAEVEPQSESPVQEPLVFEPPVQEPPVYEAPIQEEPVESTATTRPLGVPRPEESTVIGTTILISGEITSAEGITVRGVLEGTLTMESCRLVIEAGGTVAADVQAGSVAVCSDGTLTGKVRAASFVVDDGANFNGQIELIAR
jgi:cytoskeletal protein CcmA (bactofilin family)